MEVSALKEHRITHVKWLDGSEGLLSLTFKFSDESLCPEEGTYALDPTRMKKFHSKKKIAHIKIKS